MNDKIYIENSRTMKFTLDEATALALGKTLLTGGSSSCFGGYERNLFPFTTGFVVGGLASELSCEMDNPAHFGMGFQGQVRTKEKLYAGQPMIGVGTWIDKGRIYFDIIQVVHERSVAEMLCVDRGETAYYDIEAGKSVYIELINIAD